MFAVTVTRPVQLSSPLRDGFVGQKLEKDGSVIGVEDVTRRVAMQVVLRDFTFPRSRLYFLPDTIQKTRLCLLRKRRNHPSEVAKSWLSGRAANSAAFATIMGPLDGRFWLIVW